MLKRVRAAAAALLVLTAGSGAEPIPAQEAAPDPSATTVLSGDWVLNRALSDDPSEQIPRAAVPPGSRGREAETRPSGTDQLRRAIERFSISQTDSTIVLTYPDRDLVLVPDGEEHSDVVNEGLEIEYRAWRDGAALVIERRRDGGMTLTERYTFQEGTGRLHVLTRLEGERLPRAIAFVRVYDPGAD